MTIQRPIHLNVAAILAGNLDPRLAIPSDAPIDDLADLDRELCRAAHRFNATVESADAWASPWSYDRFGGAGKRPRLLTSTERLPCYKVGVSVDAQECAVRIQTGVPGLLPFGFRTTVSSSGAVSSTLDWDRRSRPLFPELGRQLCGVPFFPEAVSALLDAAGPEGLLEGNDPFTQAFLCILRIGMLETSLGKNPLVAESHKPEIIDRVQRLEAELATWRARLTALSVPELKPSPTSSSLR